MAIPKGKPVSVERAVNGLIVVPVEYAGVTYRELDQTCVFETTESLAKWLGEHFSSQSEPKPAPTAAAE